MIYYMPCISKILRNLIYWQEIFSFPPEGSTTTFSDKLGLHKTLAEV